MEKLVLLHPPDNVLIVRQAIGAGEQIKMGDNFSSFKNEIPLGHLVYPVFNLIINL